MSLRRRFCSSRRSLDAFVGFVGRRFLGTRSAWRSDSTSRSVASSRLRHWLRSSWATARSTGPALPTTRRFCASESAEEAQTSKLASTRVSLFCACWPPGPLEREKRSSISLRGIETDRVTRIGSSAMRWILTAVCLAALCAGCRSGERHVTGPPLCAARVTWNGTVYYGETFSSLPPATLMLDTGGRPTCGGVNGGEAGASSTVELRRLIGVDPRVAVAVKGEPEHAYLARGYFVQLPSHPLHRSLRPWQRSRSELKGCGATRPVELAGTVLSRTGAGIGVARGRGKAFLFVDPFTRVRGLERFGLPYVAPGQRVAVDATACLSTGGGLRKLVPRLIRPA